jgi:predicted acetyltransferase
MPEMRGDALRLPDVNADIRIPSEDDREQIARVLATSLNFSVENALARSPTFPLDDMRCAYVDDRVVATAAESPFTQWFGGNGLACSGVWGVATEPEFRGAGLASACLGRLMDDARRRGTPLSALYPAVIEPYRRLGYELAGTYDEHRIALDVLPAVDGHDLPSVELVDADRDQDAIMACYARWLARRNGTIEPDAPFWRARLIERPWDEWHRAVVARDDGTITGFAIFTRVPDTSGHLSFGFGLKCTMFVAENDRTLRALIGYASSYRGLGRWLGWSGPPNDPMTLLVGTQAVTVADRYRWMLRVLDVRGALEGRGYPPIDAEATFAIEDPRYAKNTGVWHIQLSSGEPKVVLGSSHDRRPLSIGAFSSIFSGYLRPVDAVRLGYLDGDDPAADALSAILSGPDPWCPFFF